MFLSVTDDLGARYLLEKGVSLASGEYIVEDVEIEGSFYRRFIFLSSPDIVQSEALISPNEGYGKTVVYPGGDPVVGAPAQIPFPNGV